MAGKTVLVTTASFCASDSGPRELLARSGLAVRENPYKRKLSTEEAMALLREHAPVGLLAGLELLNARVLEACAGHLKVVSRCGAGLDTVDLETARRLGIKVYNTPEAPSQAVAELAVALILAVLRRVCEADRSLRRGEWKPLQGRLLGERSVGVVGLGRIGAKVARLVSAFGAKVLGADPGPAVSTPKGVARVDLAKLLRDADVVTLHLPGNKENAPLLNKRRLGAMRPGGVLINTSRASLVDEAALLAALKSGRLAGAGLDVFEAEPYQGPLKDLPQVVLTCHMGSAAQECRARMEREAAENLLRGLRESERPPRRGVTA